MTVIVTYRGAVRIQRSLLGFIGSWELPRVHWIIVKPQEMKVLSHWVIEKLHTKNESPESCKR